ncbi:MAG: pitrilysin family protein, partial [Candidatus Spechtbacterales bacterium]
MSEVPRPPLAGTKMDIDYKKSKLQNGVRVISIPLKNTAVVTSLVLVGTGSHYEPKELSGTSHFLEHLFFKGSKKYPNAAKIATMLDGLGAEYNAFTGEEETGFYVKTVSDKTETALDVMCDYLNNPLFAKKEIERERGVILEELHMYQDIPQRHAVEILMEELYGDQPAGRNTGGNEETVMGIKPSDIKDYFKEQYKGDNIVAVFAGDISHTKARDLARKYLSGLPSGQPYKKEPVLDVENTGPKARIEKRASDQTHIAIGFQGYDLSDKRRYALDVLAVILGGGMSSRLFSQVREKRGLAYYVRAGTNEGTDFGYFAATAGVANKKVDEAVRVIVRELKKLKKEPVSAQELRKAKNSIEGHTLLNIETSDALALELGAQEVLLNNIITPEEY